MSVVLLAACTSPLPEPPPSTGPAPQPADRDRLAGLAAAAKDQRYVATYTLQAPDRPERTVTVAFGTDGTWVVAVPAGVLSGLADVAIYCVGRRAVPVPARAGRRYRGQPGPTSAHSRRAASR